MKKILIVDDNEDLLELLKETFTAEGYETECITNANNICDAAHEAAPHLVILDYILFGINGGELCHQLKTDERTKHLPVIIISAYPRVLESLGNYGADVIVSKPFDLNELISVVNNCFKNLEAIT